MTGTFFETNSDTVYTKIYDAPAVDRGEIYRYMGCREADEKVAALVGECLNEALPNMVYKTCYRQFAIHVDACNAGGFANGETDLSFMLSHSRDLNKNLRGCDKIIVFAATVGLGIDRLIAKYGRLSPVKSLCFQAIGAERIESLCESFNNDVKMRSAEEGCFTRPRFSPGYGDLPLEVQKDIFRVLDCYRRIGLSLNDSLLMSPSKSVTAFIGIGKDCPGYQKNHGELEDISLQDRRSDPKTKCQNCQNQNCAFRREK